MFNNELWQKPAGGAGGDFYDYQIAKSVRIPAPSSTSSNNGRLTRTFSTVDSSVHWTLNFWIKRSAIGGTNPVSSARPLTFFTPRNGTSGSVLQEFKFCSPTAGGTAGDALMIVNTNSNNIVLSTDNLFRDTSAWYNIHIQADLDNGTNSERLKYFINGTEASYNTDNRGSYTSLPRITAGAWTIGDYYNYGYPIQCYFAQWAYVDGTTYAPTDFAETKNGVWTPKDLSSGITWGSAGHLLDFADASALGNDVSGNNNDWTTANIDTHDQMVDSPTFGASSTGNCCTLNPLTNQSGLTVSEGNLKMSRSSAGNVGIPTTMGASVGKYYFEVYWNNDTGVGNYMWGFILPDSNIFGSAPANQVPNTYALQNNSGDTYLAGSIVTMNGTNPTTGTIIGVAIDFDNGKIFYGQDGGSGSRSMNWNISSTGTGVPASGTNPAQTFTVGTTLIPAFSISSIGDTNWILNFGQSSAFSGALTSQGNTDGNGQGDFYYSPPTGFNCWSTGGLSMDSNVDPAQTDDNYPKELFFISQYAGNLTNRTITTENQPDLIFIRSYNQSQNWYVVDSTRVITDNKYILTNTNAAEATLPQANFTSVGATSVGISSGTWLNSTGSNMQMWMLRANGGTTSAGSGDLTSTHQVDPSGGFSIVKAVGDGGSGSKTVTHGMSAAPDCILAKNLDSTFNWDTFWSSGLTAPSYSLRLNTNDGEQSGRWGTVNSSIFTVEWNYTWVGTDNFIYYCFRNIEGYIKVGTYLGNADDDGSFVYCGFRPAFLLLREVAADNWGIYDNKRAGQNNDDGDGNAVLYPDLSNAEENQASRAIDILSNGFKLRTSNATFNASNTYVYLAIAENPFKYSVGR